LIRKYQKKKKKRVTLSPGECVYNQRETILF
jgi:hypothetical protein